MKVRSKINHKTYKVYQITWSGQPEKTYFLIWENHSYWLWAYGEQFDLLPGILTRIKNRMARGKRDD